MSATIFLAICVLGCDVLLYFLFQWTYGEKRRGLARRANSRPHTTHPQKGQPIEFVPARRTTAPSKYPNSTRFQQIEDRRQVRRIERHAYQRIVATFAGARH
jgi:hypothetical protein